MHLKDFFHEQSALIRITGRHPPESVVGMGRIMQQIHKLCLPFLYQRFYQINFLLSIGCPILAEYIMEPNFWL